MMTAEVDLASYLATLRSWAQKQGGQLPPLPALGKIRFEGDMNDGQASFGMSLGVKDLTALASYVAALKPAAAKASAGGEESKTSSEKKPETSEATAVPAGKLKVPPKREAVEVENSAEYWANRAYLCTTYGNDEAAIRFFKKAIALSPKSSNLYFQMGISYAELGYYQASLAAIDKAIDLGGPKGLYYFGRGRVLIQSGKKEQGLAEIQKAAGMGDPDALQYLQDLEKRPAGQLSVNG